MKTFIIDSTVWRDILIHPDVMSITGPCPSGMQMAAFDWVHFSPTIAVLKNVIGINFLVTDNVFIREDGTMIKSVNSPSVESIVKVITKKE